MSARYSAGSARVIEDGMLETLAAALGAASVKLLVLMSKILEPKGVEQTIPTPRNPRVTRLDF